MLTEPDFIEKKIIFFYSQNEKISFKNDNILIIGSDNEIKMQLSCYRIFAIFIVGGVSITTGIIAKSKKFGFSIVLFTTNFKVYTSIGYSAEGNTLLRKKQYTNTNDAEIAKQIIINKIENQKYILKKLRDNELSNSIINLDEIIEKLESNCHNNNEIMGFEGVAAKVYFRKIFKEFNWNGRQPRLKRDKLNLLLDIGYTVLFNYIEAILNIYGFDIYKGNLHKEFYNRKSLVCDMIEPFRPIIDYKIRKMMKLSQLKNYRYTCENNQYQLHYEDSNNCVKLILEEIAKYKTNIFRYIQQYYRWFMKNKNIEDFPKADIMT